MGAILIQTITLPKLLLVVAFYYSNIKETSTPQDRRPPALTRPRMTVTLPRSLDSPLRSMARVSMSSLVCLRCIEDFHEAEEPRGDLNACMGTTEEI